MGAWKKSWVGLSVVLAAALLVSLSYNIEMARSNASAKKTGAKAMAFSAADSASAAAFAASTASAPLQVSLSDEQVKSLKLGPVTEQGFAQQRTAVGIIDFDQNKTTQIAPPWTGRVTQLFLKDGDPVEKNQTLFAMDSPDLAQAESTLIAAAGVAALDAHALERAKGLYAAHAMAQKDFEQAQSDQQTAQGAYASARAAVKIFGLSDAQMNQMITSRHVDSTLLVRSPMKGWVTARSAAPGALVQPGNSPSPYTVSDLSRKWMVASVAEADVPLLHVGQSVEVTVAAYPGRVFQAKIDRMSAALDPNTHRMTVTSVIADPKNELHPQMLANFALHIGAQKNALSVPESAVVREGDGTFTVWARGNGNDFVQKVVQPGLRSDGVVQILAGLKVGDAVVTEGGVFLSNMASGGGGDD